MLDQLIESKTHLTENRRRGGFLLSVFTAVASFFSLALIYSLFSYNPALAGEKLDLSSLVAPVEVPAQAPETAEPEVKTIKPAAETLSSPSRESRMKNIQRTDENPIDTTIPVSTERNNNLSRPTTGFNISPVDSTASSNGSERNARNGSGGGDNSVGIKSRSISEAIEDDAPPVLKKPTPKPLPTVIRKSRVLNGEAKDLVIPTYPKIANAVHASGTVNVQVMIDEEGNVTSANAVSGHPLLRQAAEQAARRSKFTPTILGDQKVKVTGVIVYNFIPQ